eukprot:UN08408
MIRFPCQKATILEVFTYFQINLTIHSFQESCTPMLVFKNLKNIHLSWISNFHALNVMSSFCTFRISARLPALSLSAQFSQSE